MFKKEYDIHNFKAAAYVRLSREDGDKPESDSIANQKEFIERHMVNYKNISLEKFFIDDGYTGTNFDRPAFKDMLEDIYTKSIDCVIVKDLSRFGRDYIDVGRYLEREFPKRHIRFISISDGIDNLNQRYDISMPIKNIVNAQYAEDISKKVMASISTKQKKGQFIGAFASYGYAKDPNDKNKLIIDEPAAIVVRRIYQMFISGIGTQTIARRLNSDGIPCPSKYKELNGQKYHNSNKLEGTTYWTYSTIRHILKSQIYAGNMVQHKYNASRYNYDSRLVPESEWITVKNTHEPIVSVETWEAVQNMMRVKYKSANLKASHIFSGIVRCKECGRGMTKIRRGGIEALCCGSYKRLGSDICTRHGILLKELNDIVLDAINKHIERLCNIEAAITKAAAYDKINNDIEKRISLLRSNIENIKQKKRSMYTDYQDMLLTREEYIEYNNSYTKDIEFMSKEILRLQKELKASSADETQKEWFLKLIKHKKLDCLTRELILAFIDVIYISESPKNSEKKDKKIVLEIVFNFKDKINELQEAAGL